MREAWYLGGRYDGCSWRSIDFIACYPFQLRMFFISQLALTGDQGGNAILETHRAALVTCPVANPGVLKDVDLSVESGCRKGFGGRPRLREGSF